MHIPLNCVANGSHDVTITREILNDTFVVHCMYYMTCYEKGPGSLGTKNDSKRVHKNVITQLDSSLEICIHMFNY